MPAVGYQDVGETVEKVFWEFTRQDCDRYFHLFYNMSTCCISFNRNDRIHGMFTRTPRALVSIKLI